MSDNKKKTGRLIEVGNPDDFKNENPCVASVLASRVAIFLPSKRNAKIGRWDAETSWGKVSVEGRLTQNHRAVLDAIFAFPLLASRLKNKGEFDEAVFIINPYFIAKKAGVSHDRDWFENTILEELRTAKVRIETKNGSVHCAGIISEWERNETYEHKGVIKEMTTIKIRVSSAWMRIMDETMVVRYSKLIEKIGKMESGAAQGLVRFLLTHREAHYRLKEALIAIKAIDDETSKQNAYKTIKAIVANREYLAENFGIAIDKKNEEWFIDYKKHAEVSFSPPSLTQQ